MYGEHAQWYASFELDLADELADGLPPHSFDFTKQIRATHTDLIGQLFNGELLVLQVVEDDLCQFL